MSLVLASILLLAALAESAPEQAAGAAIAVGIAIVPYCFARSVESLAAPVQRRSEPSWLLTVGQWACGTGTE